MKTFSAWSLALLTLTKTASAAPVINWVATNGDTGFTAGSELTNSPVTTDADAETIIGSFPEVTLTIGQTIVLSGSITINGGSGTLPGDQLRWGIFDAPGTPTTGNGSNYVGVWATVATTSGDLNLANGSTTNPFSGSATTTVSTASDTDGGNASYGEALAFALSITRINETQISTSGSLSDGAGFLLEWPETTSTASPSNFTYDSAGFLIGGTLNANSAICSNISVDGITPPADTDMDGMPDDFETANGLDPETNDADLDLDGDNLSNLAEYRGADGSPGTGDETNPNDSDSDDDLSDDDQELIIGTDPNNPDSDGDTLLDGVETGTGEFQDESNTGTDPLKQDTDGDSVRDDLEVSAGTNPNDPESNFGVRLFGIDFNSSSSPGSPSYSGLRVISGNTSTPSPLTKKIGPVTVTVASSDTSPILFHGANGDASRVIPGGDLSRSFLVADFAGSQSATINITLEGLQAGTYAWTSYHLEPINDNSLGFASGTTSTSPNIIDAKVGGLLKASVTPTSLGTAGLGTTFIADNDLPTLTFAFTHDGTGPVTIELSARETDGVNRHLFLNGFEIYSGLSNP